MPGLNKGAAGRDTAPKKKAVLKKQIKKAAKKAAPKKKPLGNGSNRL